MRIGVFLPNWIGDVAMATPALRALREYFGQNADIVGIMRPYVQQVLAGTPWLDDRLVYDRYSLSGICRLVSQLRQHRFDTVLLLPNSASTSLFAWLGGARQRIGFARHGRGLFLTHSLQPPRDGWQLIPRSAVDQYLDVVRVLGCPAPSKTLALSTTAEQEQAADHVWRQCGWKTRDPVAVLHTGGGYGAAKMWPAEYFSNLARRLVQDHQLRVLFLCGPAERDTVEAICRHANHPDIQSLARHELTIGLSKACVRRGRIMVTTDSGPRHLAVAFGVPTVTIFGPTDPRWSHNYAHEAIDLQLDVECGPCGQRTCPREDHRCMRDLSVDQVATATSTLLAVAHDGRAA